MRSNALRIPMITLVAMCLAFVAGCSKKNDAISQAEKTDKINGVAVPGIEETKQIAEEGFIYGLPIVMNYAVMYQFAVDRNSSQFKAPFNQIKNVSCLLTRQPP